MNDFTPKYILIQEFIIEKINSGEYKIGKRIPSEDKLSKMFNVSRITSNKAVSDLEIMGIVERIRGKGTFVKTNVTSKNSFNHVLSKSYKISSEVSEGNTHSAAQVEKIGSDEYISNQLNIKLGDPVYKITRYMLSDEEIIGIDYSFIPLSIFAGMELDEEKLESLYIHDYLKSYVGMKPKYLHVHINARLPEQFEAEVLNVEHDKPVIIWETNVIDESNNSIALTTTIARSDKYRPFINFEL